MIDIEKRPNWIPWPPLIYVGALAGSILLDEFFPIDTLAAAMDQPFTSFVGVLLIGFGLALDATAMVTMYRARTNILPHRRADKFLTSGVFAFTRNPIYVGNTLLLSGVALYWPSVWLIPGTIAAALAVDRFAIRREEAHLAARFGPEFEPYARRTPRWIGFRKKTPPDPP